VPVASAAAQPPAQPPQSYNPVKGYSVEEAKRLRFIKPTKPVPEDYGAEEGTGAPKSGQEIPMIRYATDTVRGNKPKPLPAELAQPATPQQQAIIAGLNQAAAVNAESPALLQEVARRVLTGGEVSAPPVPVFHQPPPGPVLPPPVLDASPGVPPKLVAPPIPTNPTPTVMTPLEFPKPVLTEGVLVEDELPAVEGAPEDAPEPAAEVEIQDRVEAASRPKHPEINDEATGQSPKAVTCPLCAGKKFAAPRYLRSHAQQLHPDQVEQLMAPYASA
jgi:hypothetical protein